MNKKLIKQEYEDKNGIIREYENGDFDVEFKNGLDEKEFKKAVISLNT